jgi:RNA polymerase sigma factor for flagellar operon FliA
MASAVSSIATTTHMTAVPSSTITATQVPTAASSTVTTTQAARDQMVLEHLPLVKAMAASMRKNLPANVDLDDLLHAGILGLFGAIESFDPHKKVLFSSFARYRIRGAMLDSLRKLDWASRKVRRCQRQAAAATCELTLALGRVPAEAEVAEKLGMDIDSWHKMILDFRNAEVVSTTMGSDEEGHQLDLPCKQEIHPDSIYGYAEMCSTLHVVTENMPTNYRTVLSLHYGQDMTMRDIGVRMNVHESRISQIHKQALKKMRLLLETSGVESAMAF